MPTPKSIGAFMEEAFQQKKNQLQFWTTIVLIALAYSTDSASILCVAFLLSDTSFQTEILGGSASHAGFFAAALIVGMLTGSIVFGILGDCVGRKPLVLLGMVCTATCGVLSVFVGTLTQITVLRLLAGLGIGCMGPPLAALAAELAPPSLRGFVVAMVSGSWVFGSIYVAAVAWISLGVFHNWRVFLFLCSIPAVVIGSFLSCFITESPLFLAQQQDYNGAVSSLDRLARQMGCEFGDDHFVSVEEIMELYTPKTMGTDAIPYWTTKPDNRPIQRTVENSVKSFLKSFSALYASEQCWTTLLLQVSWGGLSFATYGLGSWINELFLQTHLHNIYFNAMLFSLALLPGNAASVLLIETVSRKGLVVVGFLASALSLALCATVAATTQGTLLHTVGIVGSVSLYHSCEQLVWNSISAITTEHCPTVARSMGYGMCSSTGKLTAASAQFVNAALVSEPVAVLALASFGMVIAGFAQLILPGGDMRKVPLDDMEDRSRWTIKKESNETSSLLANRRDGGIP